MSVNRKVRVPVGRLTLSVAATMARDPRAAARPTVRGAAKTPHPLGCNVAREHPASSVRRVVDSTSTQRSLQRFRPFPSRETIGQTESSAVMPDTPTTGLMDG